MQQSRALGYKAHSSDCAIAHAGGAETTCCAGDLKMASGEAGKFLKASGFPFKDANTVADTIVELARL